MCGGAVRVFHRTLTVVEQIGCHFNKKEPPAGGSPIPWRRLGACQRARVGTGVGAVDVVVVEVVVVVVVCVSLAPGVASGRAAGCSTVLDVSVVVSVFF